MLDLAAIKNELNITYDDPQVDDKVAGILARSENHVRELCAIPSEAEFTFTEEQLVRDCCRYTFNEVFAAFNSDYIEVINGCRSKRLAAAFAEDNDDEQGE